MKVGIVIDTWKCLIFERHLRQAGYAFELSGQLTDDTMVLQVVTTNPHALAQVVAAANAEAARTKQ